MTGRLPLAALSLACALAPGRTAAEGDTPDPGVIRDVADSEAWEARLLRASDIVRTKLITGRGDSLTIKITYAGGWAAAFKPNHYKIRRGTREWARFPTRPFQPELAVYALSKLVNREQYLVTVPPVVRLDLPRDLLLEQAVDDPDTARLDEIAQMRRIMRGHPGYARPAFSDAQDGMLTGYAELWMPGRPGLPGAARTRQVWTLARHIAALHAEEPRRDIYRQIANMFVLDYLVENNDRSPANVLHSLERDRVYLIDNDDASFLRNRKKGYMSGFVKALGGYDPRMVRALDGLFQDAGRAGELAAVIFAPWVSAERRGRLFAGMRAKYLGEIRPLLVRKPLLR
ncbi:MAG TPA: hypothetical protein VM285_03240 [Polyangia bacterium]|nr:hypothetical protein [Polyangia bacterium]